MALHGVQSYDLGFTVPFNDEQFKGGRKEVEAFEDLPEFVMVPSTYKYVPNARTTAPVKPPELPSKETHQTHFNR